MSDVAALGLAVDSSQVASGAQALNSLSNAAKGAQEAADKLKAATAGANAAAAGVAPAMMAGTQATEMAAKALGSAAAAHTAHGNAAKFNALQMMEVAHVSREMAEMLATGVSPMRALAMEGARIATFFQMGPNGVGGTLSAVTGVVRTAATGFLGLATATAAAAAVGTAAAISWSNAQDRLARSLMGSGAAAGLSLSAANRVAELGAQRAGISAGAGRDLAAQLASTGNISGDMFAPIIGTARQFSNFTGQSVSDAGGELARAFADPTKGAADLNKELGFLDAATAHTIATFQAQGNTLGAQRTLFDAYSASLAKATDQTWAIVKVWEQANKGAEKFLATIGHVIVNAVHPDLQTQLESALKANTVASDGYTGRNPFIPDPAKTTGPKVMDAWAAIMADNSKALRDQAEQEANKRSIDASALVRANSPDLARREDLQNAATNLAKALADPDVLSRMNVSANDASKALDGVRTALDHFVTSAQSTREHTELSVRSTLTRSDAERAVLEAEQKRLDVLRQTKDATLAGAEAEGVLARQRADAQRALQDATRAVGDKESMYGLTSFEQRMRQLEINQRDRAKQYSSPSAPAAANNNIPAAAGGSSPMAILAGHLGEGASSIQSFLSAGGQSLVARIDAWCAAALNSALQQAGIQGSGSNLARSLLKVGTPVDTPQRGDIAVLSRGGPNSGLGHAGFYDSTNSDGTIRVLGGNTGGKVGYGNFDPSRVLGYRRVSGAASAGAVGVDFSSVDARERAAELADSQTGTNSPIQKAKDDLATQREAFELQRDAIDRSTAAMAAAAEKQKLLSAYEDENIPISEKLRASIAKRSQEYGQLAKEQEDYKKSVDTADFARSESTSLFSGLGRAIGNKEKPADALRDWAHQLGGSLIDKGSGMLTDGLFGKTGSPLGGLLGGLFGGGKSSTGSMQVQAGIVNIAGGLSGLLGGGANDNIFNDLTKMAGGSGSSGGGLFSGIGTFLGGLIPHFAGGTDSAPGGPSVIDDSVDGGQSGEIVNLPRGSQVIPHDVSMAMARGGGGHTFNFGDVHIHPVGGAQFTPDQISAIRGQVVAGQHETVQSITRNLGQISSDAEQQAA